MRIVLFLFLFASFSANAVLPIFKIGDRVLVRGANGVVVSQPSIDSMVSKIGTGAGNVTANGSQSFTAGGKAASVGVSKKYRRRCIGDNGRICAYVKKCARPRRYARASLCIGFPWQSYALCYARTDYANNRSHSKLQQNMVSRRESFL